MSVEHRAPDWLNLTVIASIILGINDVISDFITMVIYYSSGATYEFGALVGIYIAYFVISAITLWKTLGNDSFNKVTNSSHGPTLKFVITVLCLLCCPELALFILETNEGNAPLYLHLLILAGEFLQDGIGLGINIAALYTSGTGNDNGTRSSKYNAAGTGWDQYHSLLMYSIVSSILSLVGREVYTRVILLYDIISFLVPLYEYDALESTNVFKKIGSSFVTLLGPLQITTNICIIFVLGKQYSTLPENFQSFILGFACITVIFRFCHESAVFLLYFRKKVLNLCSISGLLFFVLKIFLSPSVEYFDPLITETIFFLGPAVHALYQIRMLDVATNSIFILTSITLVANFGCLFFWIAGFLTDS